MQKFTDVLMSDKRDITLDFIKGVAIIFMVWGHAATDWSHFLLFKRWYNLFHVPVFLIAAGWCWKPQSCESCNTFGNYVIKKIKRLWVPFVLWNCVFVLLHNFFLDINFYSDNPEFLAFNQGRYAALTPRWGLGMLLNKIVCGFIFWQGAPMMTGAMWFVQTLFFVLTGYGLVSFVMKKLFPALPCWIVQSIVAIGCVFLARYYCPTFVSRIIRHAGGPHTLTSYFIFHVGVMLKHLNLNVNRCSTKMTYLVFMGCLTVTISLSAFGSLSLWGNKYPCVVFMLMGVVGGWFMLGALAKMTSRWVAGIAYIGQHTMSILIFHFFSFKFINAIGCFFHGDPAYAMAGWPTAYNGLIWSLVYTLVGVALPIVAVEVASRIKFLIIRK